MGNLIQSKTLDEDSSEYKEKRIAKALSEKYENSEDIEKLFLGMIIRRRNPTENDLAMICCLPNEIQNIIYGNVKNFHSTLRKFKKTKNFCNTCVYDTTKQCPQINGKYRPTPDFIIRYKKKMLNGEQNGGHHDVLGKYWHSTKSRGNGTFLHVYKACNKCIDDNHFLFS